VEQAAHAAFQCLERGGGLDGGDIGDAEHLVGLRGDAPAQDAGGLGQVDALAAGGGAGQVQSHQQAQHGDPTFRPRPAGGQKRSDQVGDRGHRRRGGLDLGKGEMPPDARDLCAR
jgi:hypothetical protein